MTCLDPSPFGQVNFKSYLPSKKAYLSQTTGREFFRALILVLRWTVKALKVINEKAKETGFHCILTTVFRKVVGEGRGKLA